MAKKEKESPYVTQSRWVEGMEMIKGFFATLVSGNQKIKSELEKIKHRLGTVERDVVEIKQNVEMNTQAINLVSKQQQETQKMEFDIFKQGERITKLEKVR